MKNMKPAIKPDEIIFFYEQLRAIARANLPLSDSLRQIARESRRSSLKKAVENMAGEIEKGASLSQTLERYSREFSAYSRALIKAGEEMHVRLLLKASGSGNAGVRFRATAFGSYIESDNVKIDINES